MSSEELWKLKWEYLFNSSPESIIILDEEHTILEANDTTLKLLGMRREEVIGKKCYHVFHNTNSPPEDCPFEEMKRRNWKPCANEMDTIIGNFLVEVFPMDIPGEGEENSALCPGHNDPQRDGGEIHRVPSKVRINP